MITTPPYLEKGDRIAIIATAKKLSYEEVLPAIDILKVWGLDVILGKNVLSGFHQFSGTDYQRLQDLQDALDNPDIKAVLCARGGYGTSRIIDQVDFSNFIKQPKWIAGFSDVTVLLNHVQQWGIESLHAPMPALFKNKTTPNALMSLKLALFGEPIHYNINKNELNRTGEVTAPLTGGNLSILCTLIGTASDINTDGKILFIEDIDEYLYQLDRMMVMLKRAGKLKNLAGLIVGQMTGMKDGDISFGKSAYEIIADHVKDYSYPVCYGFPAGHEPENYTLLIGRKSSLKINSNEAELKFTGYSL